MGFGVAHENSRMVLKKMLTAQLRHARAAAHTVGGRLLRVLRARDAILLFATSANYFFAKKLPVLFFIVHWTSHDYSRLRFVLAWYGLGHRSLWR